MKKQLSILISCFLSISLFAQFYNPVSAVYDPINNRYIVSNYAQAFFDGELVIVNRHTLADSSWISAGLDSPKGMVVVGNKLYVTDVNVIREIDLNTGNIVSSTSVPGSQFLSDITAIPSYVYFSDIVTNKIYKMELTQKIVTEVASGQFSAPNGLLYDSANSRILVCSFRFNSPIQAIALPGESVYTVATTTITNCYGLTFSKDGKLLVSSWGDHNIYLFDDLSCGIYHKVLSGFDNPSYIFYCNVNDTLIIPNMMANKVVFINGNTLGLSPKSHISFSVNVMDNEVTPILRISLNNPLQVGVSVLSVTGQCLGSKNYGLLSTGYHKMELPVAIYSPGVYFLQVVAGNQCLSKKFVIMTR